MDAPSRQQSSVFSRRTVRNILVAGHRPGRLSAEQRPELPLARLDRVLTGIERSVEDSELTLRLITGASEGTDARALETAKARGWECHVIAPSRSDLEILQDVRPANQHYVQMEQPADGVPERWVAGTDEAKLSLADAVVIVWDGQPPQGCTGGTVRIAMEALRQATPVLWVGVGEEYAGKIFWLDTQRIDGSQYEQILIDEDKPAILKEVAEELQQDSEDQLVTALDERLGHQWERQEKQLEGFWAELRDPATDPGDRRTAAGFVSSLLLRPFGKSIEWPGRVQTDDLELKETSSGMLPDWFEQGIREVERIATHTRNRYQDSVVLLHGLAALAVVAAVAGATHFMGLGLIFWAFVELATLGGIGWVLMRDKRRQIPDQEAWLISRQIVEAVRVVAPLYPQLARLPALYRHIWQPRKAEGLHLARPHRWAVVQMLREAGPPTRTDGEPLELADPDFQASNYAALKNIVDGQHHYHERKEEEQERMHKGLHRLVRGTFGLVFLTVLVHVAVIAVEGLHAAGYHLPHWLHAAAVWFHHQEWPLLITASFPALAAGAHGILTNMEVERNTQNSRVSKARFNRFKNVITHVVEEKRPEGAEAAEEIRRLSLEVSEVMFREHDYWADLMKTQRLDVPA